MKLRLTPNTSFVDYSLCCIGPGCEWWALALRTGCGGCRSILSRARNVGTAAERGEVL